MGDFDTMAVFDLSVAYHIGLRILLPHGLGYIE